MSKKDGDTIPFRGIYNDPDCYRRLDATQKEIRYLEIVPGRRKDPLVCNLKYTTLAEDTTPYEALSYTWGDLAKTVKLELRYGLPSTRTKPIGFGGHRNEEREYRTQFFNITPNLQSALQQMRSEEIARRVWVDAVCINQVDDVERTEQVQIMGEVYSNAQKVLVWLGEADLSSRLAMKVLRIWNELEEDWDLVKKYSFRKKLFLRLKEGQDQFNPIDAEGIHDGHGDIDKLINGDQYFIFTLHYACMADPETAELIYKAIGSLDLRWGMEDYIMQYKLVNWVVTQAVNDLVARPWFKRTWVVQEIFRSRRDFFGDPSVTVHVGEDQVAWNKFGDFQYAMWNRTLRYSLQIAATTSWLKNDVTGLEFFKDHWDRLRIDYRLGEMADILTQIYKTRFFLATDPRDRLFAMMVLARDTEMEMASNDLIRADYSKPLAKILQDFVYWHMESNRTVDVLCAVNFDTAQNTENWPSWVPDLCRPKDDLPFLDVLDCDRFEIPRRHNDLGDRWMKVFDGTLQILGMPVARIQKTVAELIINSVGTDVDVKSDEGTESLWTTVSDYYQYRWEDASDPRYDWKFCENYLKMVGCFDNNSDAFRGFTEYLEIREHYVRSEDRLLRKEVFAEFMQRYSSQNASRRNLFNRAKTFCEHRKLFIADDGELLICPKGTQAGDTMVCLESGKVPFVLQSCGNGSHRLLGPCLFYGGKYMGKWANMHRERTNSAIHRYKLV